MKKTKKEHKEFISKELNPKIIELCEENKPMEALLLFIQEESKEVKRFHEHLSEEYPELCGKSEKLFTMQDGEFIVSHSEFKKSCKWWRRLYRWYKNWLME